MTVFVDTNSDGKTVTLDIFGDKRGHIYGKTVPDVCSRFLSYFTFEDTAYVDIRSIGAAVADTLKKHIHVIETYPQQHI